MHHSLTSRERRGGREGGGADAERELNSRQAGAESRRVPLGRPQMDASRRRRGGARGGEGRRGEARGGEGRRDCPRLSETVVRDCRIGFSRTHRFAGRTVGVPLDRPRRGRLRCEEGTTAVTRCHDCSHAVRRLQSHRGEATRWTRTWRRSGCGRRGGEWRELAATHQRTGRPVCRV